jgi:hypothetical protein
MDANFAPVNSDTMPTVTIKITIVTVSVAIGLPRS